MVFNKVRPISNSQNNSGATYNSASSLVGPVGIRQNSSSSSKDLNDFDSLSTVNVEELSYLKLKPFSRLDPTIVRLFAFLNCFGLIVNLSARPSDQKKRADWEAGSPTAEHSSFSRYLKVIVTAVVVVVTGEVVYDVNLRQSKLLVEQKRSTPLLTFVIVAYSWLTLVIPILCDIILMWIGSHLFRFYSRTTATVCEGIYFGKRTKVDSLWYYVTLCVIAFFDAVGQIVLLGVWPQSIDNYIRVLNLIDDSKPISNLVSSYVATNSTNSSSALVFDADVVFNVSSGQPTTGPKIRTYILDFILGENYAHNDLGVCIKILCLMVQFMHSYAFLAIIVSLANHYADTINNINANLDKYEFRKLLKQLIILRDSSEQISLMISVPFSLIMLLVFMRQIALNGVFIQSTMQPYENWAVLLQAFTCFVLIFIVFLYCDGLQSASKQTHRLKTEQTVIDESRGNNQSMYEFLDYLDRLSKSIRITFFNIIAINKSSLVGLYGHILTLTFVTS